MLLYEPPLSIKGPNPRSVCRRSINDKSNSVQNNHKVTRIHLPNYMQQMWWATSPTQMSGNHAYTFVKWHHEKWIRTICEQQRRVVGNQYIVFECIIHGIFSWRTVQQTSSGTYSLAEIIIDMPWKTTCILDMAPLFGMYTCILAQEHCYGDL